MAMEDIKVCSLHHRVQQQRMQVLRGPADNVNEEEPWRPWLARTFSSRIQTDIRSTHLERSHIDAKQAIAKAMYTPRKWPWSSFVPCWVHIRSQISMHLISVYQFESCDDYDSLTRHLLEDRKRDRQDDQCKSEDRSYRPHIEHIETEISSLASKIGISRASCRGLMGRHFTELILRVDVRLRVYACHLNIPSYHTLHIFIDRIRLDLIILDHPCFKYSHKVRLVEELNCGMGLVWPRRESIESTYGNAWRR